MAESPKAAWSPTAASPPSPPPAHQHPEVPPLRPLSSASTPVLRRTPSMLGSNRPNSSPAARLRGPRMSVAEGVGKPAVVAGRGAYLPFGGEVERPRPATASGLPAAGGGAGSRPASRSASALARPRSRGTTAGSLILDEDPNYVPEEDRETFWSPKEIFHLHFLRRNLHYRELFAVRERLSRSSYSQEIEAKFRGDKVGGSSLGRFGQIMKEVDEACGDYFTSPGAVGQFYDINCLPGGCASYILSRAQNYVKGVGVCLEKGWELRFNQQWHFQLMKEVHLNNGIPHHFQTVAALRNLKDGGSLVLLLDVGPRVWPAGVLCLLRRLFRDVVLKACKRPPGPRLFRDVVYVKPKAAPHADRGLFCAVGRSFDLYTAARYKVAERLAGYGQRWMHAVHADEVEFLHICRRGPAPLWNPTFFEVEFLHICSVDGATGGSISLQGGEERFSPERFVEINAGFLLKIYEPVWRSFKSYAESFLQAEQRARRGSSPDGRPPSSGLLGASAGAGAGARPGTAGELGFLARPGTSSGGGGGGGGDSVGRRGLPSPLGRPQQQQQQQPGRGPYASLSTSASTSALATPLSPSSSSSSFRRERPPAPASASASASAPSAPSSSSLRREVSFPVAAPAPLRQQWLGEG
eukprot:tig00021434_g21375.t1